MGNVIISYKMNKQVPMSLCIGLPALTLLMLNVDMYLTDQHVSQLIYYLGSRVIGPISVGGVIWSIGTLLKTKAALTLMSSELVSTNNDVGIVTTPWSNIQSMDLLQNGNLVIGFREAIPNGEEELQTECRLKLGLLDEKPDIISKRLVDCWDKYSGYTIAAVTQS